MQLWSQIWKEGSSWEIKAAMLEAVFIDGSRKGNTRIENQYLEHPTRMKNAAGGSVHKLWDLTAFHFQLSPTIYWWSYLFVPDFPKPTKKS